VEGPKNASQYSIEYCIGEVTQDKWKNGLYSKSASYVLGGLPAGELVFFRVQCLGAAGKSSYSGVVSKRVP